MNARAAKDACPAGTKLAVCPGAISTKRFSPSWIALAHVRSLAEMPTSPKEQSRTWPETRRRSITMNE